MGQSSDAKNPEEPEEQHELEFMIITLELLPHQNGNAENGTSSGNGKSGFSFSRILNLNKCQFYSSDSFWRKRGHAG